MTHSIFHRRANRTGRGVSGGEKTRTPRVLATGETELPKLWERRRLDGADVGQSGEKNRGFEELRECEAYVSYAGRKLRQALDSWVAFRRGVFWGPV